MLTTPQSTRGMVTAPHHLAAQAGLAVLRDGGNAVEAMVAMAAAIAVVYPHMNAIGGDGFWLIDEPGRPPRAVSACGFAGARATPAFYRDQGLAAIPSRGPLAANTVAGTIGGWALALEMAAGWGRPLPLSRLLEEAIHHAGEGVPVTGDQTDNTRDKLAELRDQPGFAETYLVEGAPPPRGTLFRQPALAATLGRLATAGLDDFYRGEIATTLGGELARLGSPVTGEDLAAYRAEEVVPLRVDISCGSLFNLPPPTQGLASLIIQALYDRMPAAEAEGFDFVHRIVEATKQAFLVRDREVGDPAAMDRDPAEFLTGPALDAMAAAIDRAAALPWPAPAAKGDTIWMGAIDGAGRAVSFIQSVYWEFGSGVLLRDSGVLWQNRGASFALDVAARNALAPGRRPFHTLNPALCRFADGRVMAYGCMGGEGQPQTQSTVFLRHALHDVPLQEAVTRPRWLLGRTWGAQSVTLKLESRTDPAVLDRLRAAGHDVEVVEAFTPVVGHAGALVRHPDGRIEGAADPRSDGAVAGY